MPGHVAYGQSWAPPMLFHYTNWRGERALRRAAPIRVKYTETEHHPRRQWLMEAFDYDRQEIRWFAMADMEPVPLEPAPAEPGGK